MTFFALVVLVIAALFGYTQIKARQIGEAFPPRGEFVAVDGGHLHLTQKWPIGTPRANILLLHGASGNQADLMSALGDQLASDGFRVIAVDRPGSGWSDRPDGQADASPARQATLIRAALAAIGVNGAVVVGHSLAGVVAENFALDHVAFTKGLVLVAPVTHPWPGGIAWYYHVAASPWFGPFFCNVFTLPLGELSIDAAIKAVFAPMPVPKSFAGRTAAALVLRPAAFAANAQDVAALADFVAVQAPREPAITAPTAIITGDHDGVVLTHLHAFASAKAIPGATLTVLPGVGHSPQFSDSAAVIMAIEDVARRAGFANYPLRSSGPT